MGYSIELSHLTKEYQNRKIIKDLSIKFEENKIYGIFGRYGVGKTTLLSIISSKVTPTSGEVKVFGENPYKNSKMLNKICFSPKDILYAENTKLKELINEASKFYPSWNMELANYLTDYLKLDISNRYKDFSQLNKSAILILLSLCSNSLITLYDEPFIYLTEAMTRFFSDLILKDYNENPKTILFCHQAINEHNNYNNILQHVIILDNGKINFSKDKSTSNHFNEYEKVL